MSRFREASVPCNHRATAQTVRSSAALGMLWRRALDGVGIAGQYDIIVFGQQRDRGVGDLAGAGSCQQHAAFARRPRIEAVLEHP